jgi:hypothetical protein
LGMQIPEQAAGRPQGVEDEGGYTKAMPLKMIREAAGPPGETDGPSEAGGTRNQQEGTDAGGSASMENPPPPDQWMAGAPPEAKGSVPYDEPMESDAPPAWWVEMSETTKARRWSAVAGHHRCFRCLGPHGIEDCPEMPDAEKVFLWREYRKTIFGRHHAVPRFAPTVRDTGGETAAATVGRSGQVQPDQGRPPEPRWGDDQQEGQTQSSERPPGAYRDRAGVSAPPRPKARPGLSVEDRIIAHAFEVPSMDLTQSAREIIENGRRRGKYRGRETARKSRGRPPPPRQPPGRKRQQNRSHRGHRGRGRHAPRPGAQPRHGRGRGQGQPASEAWSATRDQVEALVANRMAAAGSVLRGNPRAASPRRPSPRVVVDVRLVPPTPRPPTSWTAWARSIFGAGPPSQPNEMIRADLQGAYIQIPLGGTSVPGVTFPGGGWPPDGGDPFRG